MREFGLAFGMHIQMALADGAPLADVHRAILLLCGRGVGPGCEAA